MTPNTGTTYPARLTGELGTALSRWLWLVKWLLVIPHAWCWRSSGSRSWSPWSPGSRSSSPVATRVRCSTSTSGCCGGAGGWASTPTPRSAPTATRRSRLARTDYPADFDVEYPERLSRGLVLVKSWLLAIPQLIMVSLLTDPLSTGCRPDATGRRLCRPRGISLLGLLVLVGGLALLFDRPVPAVAVRPILGLNRWVYRVLTYVALMRDEYPPFRLQQGGQEDEDVVEPAPTYS